jgi:hypothetical protein
MKTSALIVLLAGSLVFYFFNKKSSGWDIFSASGLPEKGESYSLLYFANETTGYLGGESEHTGHLVLYKTSDGGHNWKKMPEFEQNGNSFTGMFSFGDTLVIVSRALGSDTNYILRSTNNGKSWIPIFASISDIRQCKFSSPSNGVFIVGSDCLSLNGTRVDTTLSVYDDRIEPNPIFVCNHVINFSKNFGTGFIDVSVYELSGKLVKKIPISKRISINTRVIEYSKDEVCFGVKDDSSRFSSIMKINLSQGMTDEISLGDFKEYSISDIYLQGERIIAIANKPSGVGVLGIDNEALISLDKGKTWQREEIPMSSCYSEFGANTFYGNKFISDACTGWFRVKEF